MTDQFIESLTAQVNAKVTDDALRSGIMTLGALRTALALLPPDMPVVFDQGGSPADVDSYRGYYERLALSTQSEATTAADVIALLDRVDGQTLQGYKGGYYEMDAGTFIHAAEYGWCGPAIVGVSVNDGRATLQTHEEGW